MISRSRHLLAILCLAVSLTASASMRPSHAAKAMVVSIESLATDAGVDVMRDGGNAIDAAVATGCPGLGFAFP